MLTPRDDNSQFFICRPWSNYLDQQSPSWFAASFLPPFIDPFLIDQIAGDTWDHLCITRMAPSNPTPGNTTISQSFNGNDFFNNLFTDLTPVLTLFGEQVTKQFLSLSMGWPDSLLISVFPIGILTIVVSAIRVGGSDRLKSLIGR